MLKNVKSSYFTQTVFTFIKEGNKLKVLKYNKDLQKEMNISLINYKFYTGRYIIYGQNGKGKEYDGSDDTLIFEGEYLNGERNGKGKEYNKYGELLFEGEYLRGKRNGKGKAYYQDIVTFEGEYRDEKKSEGKVYDKKGNIIYQIKNIK